MKLRSAFALAAPVAALLASCATPDDYPSLAIRDSERVSGTFEVPDAPPFAPTPTEPATIERLEVLAASAIAAHQRFMTSAVKVRPLALAAAGKEMGGEEWSVAQVAIAGLESVRTDSLLALADIDKLYVDAATQGGEIGPIEPMLQQISAIVDEQNRVIADLLDMAGS